MCNIKLAVHRKIEDFGLVRQQAAKTACVLVNVVRNTTHAHTHTHKHRERERERG